MLWPASKRYASPRARLSSAQGRRIKDGPVTGDGRNGARGDVRAGEAERPLWVSKAVARLRRNQCTARSHLRPKLPTSFSHDAFLSTGVADGARSPSAVQTVIGF